MIRDVSLPHLPNELALRCAGEVRTHHWKRPKQLLLHRVRRQERARVPC